MNPEVADKYNIFAIDQRAIGESEPRLACPSNTATLPPVGSIPKLSDFSPECPCSALTDSQFKFQRDEETQALTNAKDLIMDTPVYKTAVLVAHNETLGECADICHNNEEHVDCKACLAGVSVPGYCAGHQNTTGC